MINNYLEEINRYLYKAKLGNLFKSQRNLYIVFFCFLSFSVALGHGATSETLYIEQPVNGTNYTACGPFNANCVRISQTFSVVDSSVNVTNISIRTNDLTGIPSTFKIRLEIFDAPRGCQFTIYSHDYTAAEIVPNWHNGYLNLSIIQTGPFSPDDTVGYPFTNAVRGTGGDYREIGCGPGFETIQYAMEISAMNISTDNWLGIQGSMNDTYCDQYAYLQDSSGNPVNQTGDLSFRIYSVQSLGTHETIECTGPVVAGICPVTTGSFSSLIDTSSLGQACWIGVLFSPFMLSTLLMIILMMAPYIAAPNSNFGSFVPALIMFLFSTALFFAGIYPAWIMIMVYLVGGLVLFTSFRRESV